MPMYRYEYATVIFHGPLWMQLVEEGWRTHTTEGEWATMIRETRV